MIYLGKNAVGISDTIQVVSEDIVNRVNAVEIKETVSTPSNILTIYDGADNVPVDEIVVGIEPVQDLHGYDNPWPAGGGKNVLAPVVSSTLNGITCTVVEDGTVTLNGTATDVTTFEGPYNNFIWDGTTQYWLSGCPSGGDYSAGYSLRVSAEGNGEFSKPDIGSGIALQSYTSSKPIANKPLRYTVVVRSGVVCNNLVFKPMLSAGTSAGDYAPYSNICPISGRTGCNVARTGKNLCEDSVPSSYVGSNGVLVGNSSDYSTFLAKVKKGATYSVTKQDTTLVCGFYTTKPVVGSVTYNASRIVKVNTNTFTAPIDGYVAVRSTRNDSDVQIEVGSTVSSYEPYRSNTYSITFPTEAGIIYGGTLTVRKDGTGTLAIDKATVNMKNSTNTFFAIPDAGSNFIRYNGCSGRIYGNTPNSVFISADYKWALSSTTTGLYNTLQNGECGGQTTVAWIVFREDRIADDTLYPTKDDKITAFKELLSDGTICYPVNTSRTYELTPAQITTLLGINHFWADTGAIQSITYSADPKMYVDQHIPEVPVQDVQVNGVSAVTDRVVNIPIGRENIFGVCKVKEEYGTSVYQDALAIKTATDNQIKSGASGYNARPITPANQNKSVFYGLAKAAGDTTQSASSNAVGVYTETAKSKISDMLSAPVTVSGTTPSITALPGVRYICGECSTLSITVPESGIIDVTFTSGSTATVLTVTPPTGMTMHWANGFDPTSLDADTVYEINIMDGCYGVVGTWT